MTSLLPDLRHAFRGLLKSPAFALAAVLTLALGIGANTAMFSLVDRMLLRALPFPKPERLVVVNERRDDGLDNLSWPDFMDLQRESAIYSGLAAFDSGFLNLTGDGEPERLQVGWTTWNLFEILGVAPLHGRTFTAAEGDMNGPKSAVLTHRLWVRRFGADPAIVGRTIRLDGEAVEVAGVMPKGFEMPYRLQNVDLFLPIRLSSSQQQSRGFHFLYGLGRLKAGATLQQARQETGAIIRRLAAAYPESNYNYWAKVVPLQEEVVGRSRPVLLLLQATVAFVLLIACANVANLLLARNASRERELAIRAALGAGRRRLVMQLLTEGLVLAVLGAGFGLGIASLALRGLAALLPFSIPGGGLDGRILAFTLLLALLSIAVFSLLPAWQASRPHLVEGLREGTKGTASPAQRRVHHVLVATEVALATSLLIGAGLMVRSLWSLQRVDPGFKSEGVLTTGLVLPQARYADSATQRGFIARLVDRAARSPGVTNAAAVDTLPFGGFSRSYNYSLENLPNGPDAPSAQVLRVTPGFFEALGIPLLRGRSFKAGEERVALVTSNFALRHWPGQEALGRRISVDSESGPGPWLTVVGVAGNLRTRDLSADPRPVVFLPLLDRTVAPLPMPFVTLVLKGRGPAESLQPGLKAALREQDPDLPLSRVLPMTRVLENERQDTRAKGLLFAAFGTLALLLSAVGIFGVTSFLVTQRTREIGIRMALGAQVRDVLALVLGQGLRVVALGLAVGLGFALLLARVLKSQIFGVTALDPGTYAAVLILLAAVGLLACLLPALRAIKVDPVVALRNE